MGAFEEPVNGSQVIQQLQDAALVEAGAEGSSPGPDVKSEIGQGRGAVWQIVRSGSEQQRRAAVDVLVETRRKLYGILADGAEPEDEGPRIWWSRPVHAEPSLGHTQHLPSYVSQVMGMTLGGVRSRST
ncbi:MAG: hypothetical protein Q7J48_09750 [Nocardioides sp.]|nr:hypothetical protein [Nocardioides sp.]